MIAVAHGRPRAINLEDANVRVLCLRDFEDCIVEGGGDLFIPYVEICCLLGDLTEACSRGGVSRAKRLHCESVLFRWPRVLPEHLCLSQKQGTSNSYTLSAYNFNARQLHLPYFVSLAILGNSGLADTVSPQAIIAASFVAGIYEEFLARDEIRFLAPIFGRYCLAAGIFLVSLRPFPNLWEAAQPDLEIFQICLKELSKRWRSAVGGLKALQWVINTRRDRTNNVLKSPAWLNLEQQRFFDRFAPDLCRMWIPYENYCNVIRERAQYPITAEEIPGNNNGLFPDRIAGHTSAAPPFPYSDDVDLTDPALMGFRFGGMENWFANERGVADMWDMGTRSR